MLELACLHDIWRTGFVCVRIGDLDSADLASSHELAFSDFLSCALWMGYKLPSYVSHYHAGPVVRSSLLFSSVTLKTCCHAMYFSGGQSGFVGGKPHA